MLLGKTLNIRNLHGHIHNYSMPIAEDINVGVDAPERGFLKNPLPFGTPISENLIDEIADYKEAEIKKLKISLGIEKSMSFFNDYADSEQMHKKATWCFHDGAAMVN